MATLADNYTIPPPSMSCLPASYSQAWGSVAHRPAIAAPSAIKTAKLLGEGGGTVRDGSDASLNHSFMHV